MANNAKSVTEFLQNKSPVSLDLFNYFIQVYNNIGLIELRAAKTMIGIYNTHRSIAWATQFGRNFVHIVFPFEKPYSDNECFIKIAQVPGDAEQFNHHFRIMSNDDINEEVKKFMTLAYSKSNV